MTKTKTKHKENPRNKRRRKMFGPNWRMMRDPNFNPDKLKETIEKLVTRAYAIVVRIEQQSGNEFVPANLHRSKFFEWVNRFFSELTVDKIEKQTDFGSFLLQEWEDYVRSIIGVSEGGIFIPTQQETKLILPT